MTARWFSRLARRHVNTGHDALEDESMIGHVGDEVNAVFAGFLEHASATLLNVGACRLHSAGKG